MNTAAAIHPAMIGYRAATTTLANTSIMTAPY